MKEISEFNEVLYQTTCPNFHLKNISFVIQKSWCSQRYSGHCTKHVQKALAMHACIIDKLKKIYHKKEEARHD